MIGKQYERLLLVRPEYLNSMGALFGGYMMMWADEMAFIAASLEFPGTTFVTKIFGEFNFIHPLRQGDLVQVISQVESRGNTSCRVQVWSLDPVKNVQVFRTHAILVNVSNGVKTPIPAPL